MEDPQRPKPASQKTSSTGASPRRKEGTRRTRDAFGGAATGARKFHAAWPFSKRITIILGALLVLVGGYFWYTATFVPPKGNNLYGICRGYIEQRLLYPLSLKVIQLSERIPDKEDKNNPQYIEYEILFSSRDSFGGERMNSVTCGFRFREDLLQTPWKGIVLERVTFNNRKDHAWTDVYYPPDKKDPRAPDDQSEDLERFQAAIPSLLQNPPDLTLPFHELFRMRIEDLKDL